MNIDDKSKTKLKFDFQAFEKIEENDLSNFTSSTIRPWKNIPPIYIISLLFETLGFQKIKVDLDKINWMIYFKFKDKVFEIHDYKFNTWSLAANLEDIKGDKILISELADEILKTINKGSKYLDTKLSKILTKQINNNEFSFNNSFGKLYRIYDFYLDKIEEVKKEWEIAVTEIIEEEIETDEGKIISKKVIDHKKSKEIESSYYFFPLVSIYFSILEFLLDIFKCLENPEINYLDFRENDWKYRFKSVFDINKPDIKKIYDSLIEIKENYRNPLSHGLNNEVNLLVKLDSHEVVPISYEFLSEKPHFTDEIITIAKSQEYIAVMKNFFNFLINTNPFNYYWLFLNSGFTIPKSKKEVDELKKHMNSIDEFTKYLEAVDEYLEKKYNGDVF